MNTPASLPPTRTLAALYAKQGLLKKAEAVYERLLETNPEDEELKEALEDVRTRRDRRGQQGNLHNSTLTVLERWRQAIRLRRNAEGVETGDPPRIVVLLGPASVQRAQDGVVGSFKGDVTAEFEENIKKEAKKLALMSEVIFAVDQTTFARAFKAAYEGCDALIVSPGTLDLETFDVSVKVKKDFPVFEVQFENVQKGQEWPSPVSSIVQGYLAGFGTEGFMMAMRVVAAQVYKIREMGVQ